ncbi:MAG: putative Ig domain-containing protein [Pseudomonadota bacterium]
MLGLGLDTTTLSTAIAVGSALPPPFLLSPPAISGSGEVGTQISGTTGVWQAGPGLGFAWAWQRDGLDIAGASGVGSTVAPYVTTQADAGRPLRLRITAIDVGGSITAYSATLIAHVAPVAATGSWQFVFARNMPIASIDLSAEFSGTDLAFALAAASSPLPAGLTLSASGILSGTPNGGSASLTVTVEASNPLGTAQRNAQIDVTEADLFADYAAQIYAGSGGASASFASLHSFSRTGTATRLDAAGAIETVSADTPRFDHSVTGLARGLLVEAGGTQILGIKLITCPRLVDVD